MAWPDLANFCRFPTGPAQTLNLECLADRRETKAGSHFADSGIDLGIVELRDRPAGATNKELTAVGDTRIGTTNKCVERIKPVDELCFNEKLQRPVDGRRCCFVVALVETVEDVVGSYWPVAVPDELQYTPPLRSKSQASVLADLFRSLNCLLHTMPVIVFLAGKTIDGRIVAHLNCSQINPERDCTAHSPVEKSHSRLAQARYSVQ